MSPSDNKLLLIYSEERQDELLVQKQHLYCSPAMSAMSSMPTRADFVIQ